MTSAERRVALRVVGGLLLVMMLVLLAAYIVNGHVGALVTGWIVGSGGVLCLALGVRP